MKTVWLKCVELINQRNKLLVISDKYGWETGGLHTGSISREF